VGSRQQIIQPAVAMTLAGLIAAAMAIPRAQGTVPKCRAVGGLTRVAELPEGSGAAASRKVPGRIWSHNDSGKPVLVALDATGKVTGRVTVAGAKIEDWEAIASGPCASSSCLFLADIGDNDAERPGISVYRVPEPDQPQGSVRVEQAVHATYPDGPHDAETLLVTPAGEMFIVTKGETGPVALYRFPRDTRSGDTARLERVGASRTVGARDRITDGSVSPGGDWVVLRSEAMLHFYAAKDFLSGTWLEASRVPLATLREPQGEGVSFADASTLYVVGEGGGKSAPGTFGRIACGPA
jgi:hypothetical protein